jgi:D-alanyl-D-alanine carboxypeptidase
MAFAARRHGHLIIGAVLDDPSWQVRITDMRSLLDWGFEQDGIAAATPVPAGGQPDPSEVEGVLATHPVNTGTN